MYATYNISKDELNENFLDSIKQLFISNHLIISIESYDESEYLLRSPANKIKLQNAIDYVESGKPLIDMPLEEIEKVMNEENSI